jgi:hypothetical protein
MRNQRGVVLILSAVILLNQFGCSESDRRRMTEVDATDNGPVVVYGLLSRSVR